MNANSGFELWVAFLGFMAITVLLAVIPHRFLKSERFQGEYFLGGRTVGPWILGLTWIATSASGGTFIGFPALVYSHGYILLLWIGSYMVMATVGMGVLGKRLNQIARKTGIITVSDLLRDRYESPAIALLAAVAILVLLVAYMVAQFVAGARVMEVVFGLPYFWGVVLFAFSVALYTSYGGFRAVAWTDSFQAVVMLVGIVILVPFAIKAAGGLQGLTEKLAAQSPDLVFGPGPNHFLPLGMALSFFCVWPLSSLGQPHLVTRFLVFKDSQALKKAMFLMGPYVFLTYVSICIVGLAGRVILPKLAEPDHAMPAIALAAAPAWLAGIIVSAPVAAILSTVSSMLLTTTAILMRDVYQQALNPKPSQNQVRQWSYITTIAVGLVAMVFSMRPPQFLQTLAVFANTGLAASLLCPIALGLYWKRASRAAAMAGLAGGFLSFILQHLIPGLENLGGVLPFVWSLLLSLVLMVVVSGFSKPPPPEVHQRYFLSPKETSQKNPATAVM